MENKKAFKLIIIILIILIAFVFIYFKVFIKPSDIKNDKGFFEQMISVENYELFKNDDYEKLIGNFKPYCNDRGLNVIFSSREVIYNYDFIDKYNIKSYKNLEIELLEETKSEDLIFLFRDYKITYIYVDANNKEYEMTDYYNINIKDLKIDYIKLDKKRSTVCNF